MKKIICLGLLMYGQLTAEAYQQQDPAPFMNLVTSKALKEKLSVIAGAEMEGRRTGLAGQKKAAAYIESKFKAAGLQPGMGKNFQQKFNIFQHKVTDKTLTVNGKNFQWDTDYKFYASSLGNGSFYYSEFIFLGYGTLDDYKGFDVKGKTVIILEKAESDNSKKSGITEQQDIAFLQGVTGLLTVKQPGLKRTEISETGELTFNPRPRDSTSYMVGFISEALASALLGSNTVLDFAALSRLQKGIYRAEMHVKFKKETVNLVSSNVIGMLPGTDKKNEYIILSAHYDHMGMAGNDIYYGADDDGSGTVSVIQLAEAFAAAAKKGIRPRRTLVFIAFSGEEEGLLGSEVFSLNPTVPLDKVSANLNIDMIGRVDTERTTPDTLNYVYVIGRNKMSSELPLICAEANEQSEKLVLDSAYDNPNEPEQIFYRSDHYNFAKNGVPVLFFFDGMMKADYHKTTDTVDKINFNLLAKRSRFIFRTTWHIANRNSMLKRDIPLPASE